MKSLVLHLEAAQGPAPATPNLQTPKPLNLSPKILSYFLVRFQVLG